MFSAACQRNSYMPFLAVLLCALFLSACAATGTSRPVTLTPSKGVSAGEKVDVKQGDTVYSVARRYYVSMRDIIAINRLQAPFSLTPGTQIALPAKETLYDVGAASAPQKPKPSVEVGPIGLDKEPYDTYQEALSPRGKKVYEQVAPQARHEPSPEDDAERVIYAEPRGPLNLVPPEGTPEKLEMQYEKQKDVKTVQSSMQESPQETKPPEKTKPKKPENIRQQLASQLKLKPLVFDKDKKHLRAPTPEKPAVKEEVAASGPAIYSAVREEPKYKKSELGLKPLTEPKDEKRPSFIWPVQGPMLSTYGPKSNGLKNDGVNIGAPRGTPVVAADGGTIAYAGSDIPGYGNVVLIRHASGMMTTYAHLERMFVQADSVVAKGDMVGSVGTSGGMDTPQLHFEIRRGNEALDPSKHLYGR